MIWKNPRHQIIKFRYDFVSVRFIFKINYLCRLHWIFLSSLFDFELSLSFFFYIFLFLFHDSNPVIVFLGKLKASKNLEFDLPRRYLPPSSAMTPIAPAPPLITINKSSSFISNWNSNRPFEYKQILDLGIWIFILYNNINADSHVFEKLINHLGANEMSLFVLSADNAGQI